MSAATKRAPKKKRTTKPVEPDARERAWRTQHEKRKATLRYKDTVRLKPDTVEKLEEIADEDGKPKATVLSELVDREHAKRERAAAK